MTDLAEHLRNAMTLAKAIYELPDEFEKATLKMRIADLTFQLAEALTGEARLVNELRELKAEAEEHKSNPLHWNGIVYLDNGKHPFCPACYDDRRKRIHLKTIYSGESFTCPVCGNTFEEPNDPE